MILNESHESWLSESGFNVFVSHLEQKLHAFEVSVCDLIFIISTQNS